MKFPVKGSCQCGQVSYKLHQPPVKVMACHCTECQKIATGPFSVTAMIHIDDIEFSGEMKSWSRIAESGNTNQANLCTTCGNRIYHFNPADPTMIKLKLKSKNDEDDRIFEPAYHIWVGEKLSWYELPEGVPSFEKQPA